MVEDKEEVYEFDIVCKNCNETSSSREYIFLGSKGNTLFFKCPKCGETMGLNKVKLSAWLNFMKGR